MNSLLSIGIVVHDFKLGGSERIAIRLANYWSENGHNVTIFCGKKTGQMLNLVSASVCVAEELPPLTRSKNSVKYLSKAAKKFFTDNPVDFCYIPGNYHWPVCYQLRKILTYIRPVVVTQISSLIYKPKRHQISQKLFNFRMRYLLKKSDVVVAMDYLTSKQSNDILGRNDTIIIPLPALPQQRPHLINPINHPYAVLAAGRLTEQKGFDILIDAFCKVVERLPMATLTICGDGEDRKALQTQINMLTLQHSVHLVGYVEDIRPYLDESALFVLSSRREGYGAVLLEALDARRRVVTTNCTPAIQDLFKNSSFGSIVPVDNVDMLAQAIIAELLKPSLPSQSCYTEIDRYRINAGGDLYIRAVHDVMRRKL